MGLAKSWPADLIVMGSHGRRGFEKALLGSVSEAVAMHAPCSVEIIRIKSLAKKKGSLHCLNVIFAPCCSFLNSNNSVCCEIACQRAQNKNQSDSNRKAKEYSAGCYNKGREKGQVRLLQFRSRFFGKIVQTISMFRLSQHCRKKVA